VLLEKRVGITIWQPGSPFPDLEAGEVHVWRTSVHLGAQLTPVLSRKLSEDERMRATDYRRQSDRRVFVTGRAVLRLLLARYTGKRPEELVFRCNEHGKPALAGSAIHFNVAHAGDWVVHAVAREPVGIDIEAVTDMPKRELPVEELFSSLEREQLRELPARHGQAAFFQCWVRKEAYVKALGLGLSVPLDAFAVSLASAEPAPLLRPWSGDALGASWRLTALELGSGYACAVAAPTGRVRCWDWRA
jgi:4'-phosphopantetheinyl transferase